MKKAFVVGFLSLALLVSAMPFATDAATPPASALGGSSSGPSIGGCSALKTEGLVGVVKCVISIFNILIYLMISASVVYIMYGAFNMISSEEKREAGKQTIYYGIVGLFVMISIWGFVNILVNTFGISGVTSDQVIQNKDFIKLPG